MRGRKTTERRRRYRVLERILGQAYDDAAIGKGEQRHARGRAWEDQTHANIGRTVGLGFPIGQAMKKAEEALHFSPTPARQIAELRGAINYLASAIYLIEQGGDA